MESIAANLDLAESKTYAMQVCLEELMSNIVLHGKAGSSSKTLPMDPAPLSISIRVDACRDRTVMTVEDNGRPFNVEQAPAKWIDRPLEQLQPGGLGIHLIKSFASNLNYSRTENGNRVVLEFMN
jgi:serine/threonine-protein kinase RsbW